VWNDDGAVIDWMNLPAGTPQESLGNSLHDADLLSIQSDLLDRTMVLTFSSFYLPKFHKLPLDLKFLLKLDGVQSARVVTWKVWPGVRPTFENVSYEEGNRLSEEHRAKWREESSSWSEFEVRIGRETNPPDISDVILAGVEGTGVAIHIGVTMDDGTYWELYLRASKLTVLRSDGEPIDLEQFKKLGEAYWTAFAARRNQPK
jgi:hypothetical protein